MAMSEANQEEVHEATLGHVGEEAALMRGGPSMPREPRNKRRMSNQKHLQKYFSPIKTEQMSDQSLKATVLTWIGLRLRSAQESRTRQKYDAHVTNDSCWVNQNPTRGAKNTKTKEDAQRKAAIKE
jgi:hypothetical protein